ncbi:MULTISPECIES: alpha/beta fold hydrolase [Planktothricoides]|uniref:Alpha/beta hydrolase n=2 Tax=Planktothricoides raciborskii TaxID=132608 RepID=A0AAU8JHS5_9CYAN|nr:MULTISPECIES: alpha/beta hydrolase [Planktothricoides]KOR38069.1 alpha/beta hydrolase [Planktothricoides sp. SR001]MBD2542510.1 alpha/beta hydrolase [Planktothricoides raciborskii FACHB-1370]MBD2580967.1 alpha/beta hydrolase [Planktothricoides raciborskii FACHB-1261]
MFIPIGFEQHSVVTSLGTMVYYTEAEELWRRSTENEGEPSSNDSATSASFPGSSLGTLPTLVFLHGFGGGSSAYEWSKVYPAFAADYRILAPDLIGWGRSDHPERNYQVDDYIQTIIEFLEKTGDRPTTVIASSLTAAITIRAAIARPELFKSLILTTPSGLSDFGEDYRNNFFAQIVKTPILDRFFYNVGITNPSGIRRFLEIRQFANPSRIYEEIIAAYLESAKQPNGEYAALSFVRGDLCFDLSLYMGDLTIPTAIIWGRQSQFTSPEIGQRLAKLNPTAVKVFQQLDDVGLTPQLELPGLTIGLIRKFLKLFSAAENPA